MTQPAPADAMATRYEPEEVEARWYDQWEGAGYFRPDAASSASRFVITIPPPNVTGDLHLGHALTYGIEDIVGRFKRAQGFNTLILPGTDHAGIATQNVVERQLAREGLSRHDLGRDRFVERVWQWKEEYATNIRRQFKAMGCAFDWSRERFTMDDGYVDAVLEFFIRLYREGQIYRGQRVINWCVRCHSAISDIEVDDITREDTLYYLRYPLADGSGDIVVATVRPETILGDVAVAVNPEDDRYRSVVGKRAVLPLLGRELEIIADPFVDMQFGTGAVKITPAHDFADWEVGERHGLAMPIAIDPSAHITSVGGSYEGLDVLEARRRILDDLASGGYLVKTEPYVHNVPTCERCGTVLEPLLSEQWFMRMDQLAEPAIDVVREGRVRFVPDRWARVYLDWMESIRPWTLSRQLWWGHRIPIYYCSSGHATAAKSWPDACTECGSKIERQDPDVLDTWFSSALWPFATLGWPQSSEDLDRFYPTSFMNTSSQILYLWIARMIMTGIKFCGDIPFPEVLINPTILNKQGQRMSKSLGTGVDPLELVRQYGADALRFGLITSGSTHQQDIRFSPERVELARNFANKVWNIARFILSAEEDHAEGPIELGIADRWILSRLHDVTGSVTHDLERYELSGAGQTLQEFLWSELADWYVEMAKVRLYGDDPVGRRTVAAVLWSVLERSIRLLQPYMPFLAEEIWHHIRRAGSPAARDLSGWSEDLSESVMLAPWPRSDDRYAGENSSMLTIMDLIGSVRTVRSEYRVDPGKHVSAAISAGEMYDDLLAAAPIIGRLARLEPIDLKRDIYQAPEASVVLLSGSVTLYLPLGELADAEAERERLRKDLADTDRRLGATRAKLENESFVSRAPAAVVERERSLAGELTARADQLRSQLARLEG